jgi:NAD(P)H dehydrogenase (quinone)
MRHLIIYAHPRPQSFCHAILTTAVESLQEDGHEVTVRDLYALGFDPVVRASDLQETSSENFPPEIRAEQFFIRAAEILTFIYPIWWTSMPAMMKGYFDRVFTYNFAYAVLENGPVGLLKGKRVSVFNTQSSSEEMYRANGMFEAMEKVTDDGIFRFSGMEVTEHKIFAEIPGADMLTRESYLGQVKDSMKEFEIARIGR